MVVSDAVIDGVSGAFGGIVATVATFPLMRINAIQATRIRQQPQQDEEAVHPLREGEGNEGGKEPAPPTPLPLPVCRQPRGTLHDLSELIRSSGWQALFSGLGASLIGTTVSQGIYFYMYSVLRQAAVRRRSLRAAGDLRSADIMVSESLLVAALAGWGNVLLTNPIWMVATRMQAHQRAGGGEGQPRAPAAPGPVAVARQVYAEYGLAGFWNGVGASLVMVVNPTIQYAMYEWLLRARARLRAAKGPRRGPASRPSALEVFVLSAAAKAGATVLTYPLLTIKTRMMSARKGDVAMQYTSISNAVLQIGRNEGLPGYFQGLKSKIVQSVLAAALLFVCKEKITDLTREVLAAAPAEAEVA